MKYIDAEKLRAEIERLKSILTDPLCSQGNILGPDWVAGGNKMLNEISSFITTLQQEQPEVDSTKLIELWHEDKEMLKEKDFRDDPWRLAYNAFMCGFGRGISVKKQEQPLTTEKVVEQCKKFGGDPEVIQPEGELFECPETPIKDAIDVTSRMKYIDEELKPIAEFIIHYASWNLHKNEWNQPVIEVPLFRVLDALTQRGKPYCEG